MQVQILPDALDENTARSSIGSGQQPLTLQRRVQFPHGSLGTTDQVVQLVDTRRSERRAHSGLGVRLSPWSLAMRCRRGWRPTGFHKAGVPVRFRGLQLKQPRRRWASAQRRLITFAGQVRLLDLPLTAEYAIWKSGQFERLVILSVRLRLRPLDDPVVKRHDTSPTCWK